MTTLREVIADFIADYWYGEVSRETVLKDADAFLEAVANFPEPARLKLAEKLNPWHPLPPKDKWLRTKREGENGENVCMLPSFNGEEWIERGGGRTTMTHHSFATPTHWALPAPPSEDK